MKTASIAHRATLSSKARLALLLAALGALAAGPYLNTLGHPFVYDDLSEIVENASIRRPGDVAGLVRHSITRPLVNASYAVDYARSGLNPRGYHTTNIALHVMNVWLLFFLAAHAARDWRERAGVHELNPMLVGVTAAAVFAAHPVMTEAVGYVSSRSDLLSGLFFLGSLLAGRRALVSPAPAAIAQTFLLLLLALASKEVAVVQPVVLFLYDRWLLSGGTSERRARLYRLHLPLAMVIGAALCARVWMYLFVEHPSAERLLLANVLLEAEVLVRYVGLLILPLSQSIVHETLPFESILSSRAAIATASMAVLIGLIVAQRRHRPLVSFGLAWFLLLSLPSAGLVILAARGQPMAEHRVYLASCGIFLVLASGVELLWRARARARPFVLGGGLLVLALLCAATVERNRVWQHPMTLWRDAAAKAPRTWMAQYGYGKALQDDGDYERAAGYYQRAIALLPTAPDAYINLAICYLETGRPDESRRAARRALAVAPDDPGVHVQAVGIFAALGSPEDVALACRGLARLGRGADLPECLPR